jgi:transposase-like protein
MKKPRKPKKPMKKHGKPKKPLTDKEYVAIGGCRCPICGNSDVEGGGVEIDAGIAWQEVSCHACGAEWTDQYELVGYNKVEME